MSTLIKLAESGWLPDSLIRLGIRRLLEKRRNLSVQSTTDRGDGDPDGEFAELLRRSPLAVETDLANVQHYEVPVEFFQSVLGPHLKYSCCLFDDESDPLESAERAMLRLTCERAELANGLRILELGCGWGSLSLWMAQQYPGARITAVSNSNGQRQFIERMAESRGLGNLQVITADMRDFDSNEQFDRVVSVEMFEHMRNYDLLLRRVASWLNPDGKAFVHIFCHRDTPYLFSADSADDWMGRHFFTGGMMPSSDIFSRFDDDLRVEQCWQVNGMNYWHTCQRWLMNLDAQRDALLQRFREDQSARAARIALQRWRMFFMACGELFRYGDGREWFVGHYRFHHQPNSPRARKTDLSAVY